MHDAANNIQTGIFSSLFLPVQIFNIGYRTNPDATATPIFRKKPSEIL